ncbi:MAG: DUF4105 domain-containing protein [Proteiniphilum sp.]|jgi:hypothetical protein|uniref:lipoprotein N-acyltransferase Lnb domain-containing protein n=1 Tax=Proteiniphilum sp. TaxID=1926877 RepID=UPI002B209A30|nr:DUF4105 domain-containing protein [Proteiniphilum sp.]MEA5129764.1 DUF4105 domain-containing protein [Proteiniphilum sp.]
MKRIIESFLLKTELHTFIRQKKIILLPLIILFCLPLLAQVQLNDNAKISLLTASPWYGPIYAFFGHTAIRVQDDSTGVDVVFNYGYFDSSQPHFIYNFIRGKTDYVVGDTSFEAFLSEYGYRGQQVVEQELNLSSAEKQQLYDALTINALPENRSYRYNYFYDNCSTRPRDMVEKYTDGIIQYPATAADQSYRDLVHECVDGYPWYRFGIDLLIGSPADSTINVRAKMFIPDYLMHSFEEATIQRGDTLNVPLVKNSEILLPVDTERNSRSEGGIFAPDITSFVLLLLTIIVSLIQVAKLNTTSLTRFYDTLLFAIAGLAGIILLVLMYFSEHPATNPNWNFVWLNPFALIAASFFWMKSANKAVYFYHFINFALLTLFLLLWWLIPQQLPLATIPFSMSLWFRSGTNIYMLRKKRLKNKQFTTSKHLKAGWGGL